ncbi:hypothetical protein A6F57_04585 [Alteromonas stellipolaris]|uniref:hypothetical protein n=1 Tax=Alteromonas stellipolaris TaxID=233316 RepID=UPI0007B43790|nr:hypothetical protein [Alteromonas stellipolaris]ANB24547.1 hypothetical protein A6F57_04585 [Alteromonas stellipolaris]
MNTKKSGAVSYLIAIKDKLAGSFDYAKKRDSLQGDNIANVESADSNGTDDTCENRASKGMLSNMGDKLCLSKWSAFK